MKGAYSGSMGEEAGEAVRQAHLRDYWRTVWAGRRTIAAVFLVVVGIGIAATLLQPRVYRASATLEISPRAQRVVKVDDVSQIGTTGFGWSAEDRYFKTQLAVLKSRNVAERAFDALKLKEHPLFKEGRDPVGRFLARLEVEPTPETVVVTISMEGPDAGDAAAWVNAVADAYVQRNLEQASQATTGAIGSLIEQMEPLRARLAEREGEKFRYAREKGLYVPETQKASSTERLASLEKDLTQTKLQRLELEAVFRKIEQIDAERGDYFVIPQVAKDEVLRGLIREKGELESEQRKLLVTFKPGHFKVKENEAALGKLTQRIQTEMSRIISAIRTDYTLAEERERHLGAEIQRSKEEALSISQIASQYDLLKTESEEAKRLYDLVAQRVKEVDLNSSLLRNNLAILDRALPPAAPIRPRRFLNLAVSILMGLGLGIGLVFFLEYLDNTVRGTEQLYRQLGLSTLAVVPRRREADPRAEAAWVEAFSALRTAVQFSSMSGARRVLLIASAAPEDGKTLTAQNLARAMARAGEKVCLVDADLRRPTLHRHTEQQVPPGLTTYLAGEGGPLALRAALRPASGSEPALIPSGPAPPSPAELLASQSFAALVKELKGSYDWVLLDSPPAAGLTDAVLLAAQADMVVLVVRQGRTDRDLLRRSVDAVRVANPNIIGAVLNDVDLNRSENRQLYYPALHPPPGAGESEGEVKRHPAAL